MKRFAQKALSLLLVVLMIAGACPMAFAAGGKGVVMQSYAPNSQEDFHSEEYESRIGRIIFLDLAEESFPENVTYIATFDMTAENQTETVTGKIALGNTVAGLNNYDLYIGAKDGVIAPEDSSYLFADTGVRDLVGTENFDTSKVTSMKGMFSDTGLIEFDFDKFNTSKVTDMSYMFSECDVLETISGSSFNTASVRDFSSMFNDCVALKNFEIKNMDLSSAQNLNYMFYGCTSLEKIDLSTCKNTSGVKSINSFKACTALREIDFSGWNFTSIATFDDVFGYLTALTDVTLIGVTDAVNASNSMKNPVQGIQNLTVHTDNIDFTDTVIWTQCLSKVPVVKVDYVVPGGVDLAYIDFESNDAIEYYNVTIGGSVKNIYPPSRIYLERGTEIKIDIQAVEGDTSRKNLNINGEIVDIGVSAVISDNTTIGIQKYYDNAPQEPDKVVVTLSKAVESITNFFQSISQLLQDFFGKIFPFIERW